MSDVSKAIHPVNPKVIVGSRTLTFRSRKTGELTTVIWDTDESMLEIHSSNKLTLFPGASNYVIVKT
ncbi:MAG: hypothetical protein GF334_06505 [Candidatus Altiarchaeales archaeon]|nr:hypothetical protein [Candidatus Altiarchaeales archaeon]